MTVLNRTISPLGLLVCLLAASRVARSQFLRGLESTFSSTLLEQEDHEIEDAFVPEEMETAKFPEVSEEEASQENPEGPLPPGYLEHTIKEGDTEVTIHRVPIQMNEDGEEMDPWMQLALAKGIDLNEYNVTYPDGTAESLADDHRRHLVSVNPWENNNARFCQYERKKRGLRQVSWSGDLIQQSQMQAAYMARVQHIEHRSNLAAGVWAGWQIICENVSQNVKMTYNGAHMSLMNDPGHKANILNVRVNKIGVGVRRSGPYFYMCQIFKG